MNGQDPVNGFRPLVPPKDGPIPVAFVISKGAVVIDFAGLWEVFSDVYTAQGEARFQLYTVAETTAPAVAGAGLTIVPKHTFQTAPVPKVIVIPAQDGTGPAMLEWIRRSSKTADLTMSVCTGAMVLAQTGLLNGKARDYAPRCLRGVCDDVPRCAAPARGQIRGGRQPCLIRRTFLGH